MYLEYIRQWKEGQAYGPNTALFLQVGSFFELYDIPDPVTAECQTNMKKVVDILGIQLKIKKNDAPGKVDGYFAGFPTQSLHKFAHLLTRENWTVIVVEQGDELKKGKVQRGITRVLSPGTHVESAATDAFYLAGVVLEDTWAQVQNQTQGAAVLDLTTGAVHTYEGPSPDDLLHFFQVHPPKELVVWWRGRQPQEATLRRTLGIPTALIHIRQATPYEKTARLSVLQRSFKMKTMLPTLHALHLINKPNAELCLVSLLRFAEDHFPSAAEHLHIPTPWLPQNAVYMGNHALTQLNMITVRPEDSVLAMFSRTFTSMGRRAIRERLLYPITSPKELERRYNQIAAIQSLLSPEKSELETLLRQIHDLSRLHRKITSHSITSPDVLAIDQSYESAVLLAKFLESTPLSAPKFTVAVQRFADIFDVEKAKGTDTFCLRDDVAPLTAAVEKELAKVKSQIDSIVETVAKQSGLSPDILRLDARDTDLVLTAPKAAVRQVADSVARKLITIPGIECNLKKTINTIEIPELTRLNFASISLRKKLDAAVQEELPPLCEALAADLIPVWDELVAWISTVDVTTTLARVSTENKFCRPELASKEAASLQITGLRHPLIEAQQDRTEYVKHDVDLAGGWLVYGMNASGKSSLMKAVGIATILAQAGCFVPATTFRFTPFRKLFTRILNTDNLWAGLSSFAVEMTELREVLKLADPFSLVLGDEVCSGTESVSATALVGASLDWLSNKGARFIFATHLHGLTDIPLVTAIPSLKIWHLRVRYDPASRILVYERTLEPGSGSSLYGLEVAKAMDIPVSLLDTAHQIRRTLLGAAAEEEAPLSAWNGVIQRRACENCGADIVKELEVHHIRQRSEADTTGHFADGAHMNHARNLVVLCERCHDNHHNGVIDVGSVKMTSEGPVREKNTIVSSTSIRRSKWSDEQMETVEAYIRKYPNCPPSRLVFDLKQKEGIQISVVALRKIRETLSLLA